MLTNEIIQKIMFDIERRPTNNQQDESQMSGKTIRKKPEEVID